MRKSAIASSTVGWPVEIRDDFLQGSESGDAACRGQDGGVSSSSSTSTVLHARLSDLPAQSYMMALPQFWGEVGQAGL
jgi:hypothetical protein